MGKKNKRIEAQKRDNTLESAKHTMRSPKRRNQVTQDLNPSSATQSNSCKEMGEKPERTPSSTAGLIPLLALPTKARILCLDSL
jgi:hypothetical protein